MRDRAPFESQLPLLDKTDLPTQSAQLELLPADWDGENADKPKSSVVAAVKGFIASMEKVMPGLSEPTIAPTRNGGVLLEWNMQDYRLDLEFGSSHEAQFAYFDRTTRSQMSGKMYRERPVPDEFFKCLKRFVEQ
jgi:hypothetical protein